MEVTEKPQLSILVRDLWAEFFPSKNTASEDVARVVANRDWLRESLLFYGWKPQKADKMNVDIKFIDGGGVLYYGDQPCALISVINGDTLKFTYVDNRAQ